MYKHYKKRYIGIITIILSYGLIILTWLLPPDVRELKRTIQISGIAVLGILYCLFFYYNRQQWKILLLQAIGIIALIFVIMKISKPMMEEPYKYKPEHSTQNKNP